MRQSKEYVFFMRTHTKRLIALLGILQSVLSAQYSTFPEQRETRILQTNPFEKNILSLQQTSLQTLASSWFDVGYYRLELNIFTPSSYLKGRVTIAGRCRLDGVRFLTLDLRNQMHVDSVLVDDQSSPFIQNSSSFEITLPRAAVQNDTLSIDVFYQGTPVPTGFGSFYFDSHEGIPWVYTLSEPYGAKDWWPCKDDPSDKADSADIIVTCDSTFKVGSNGKLTSVVKNSDGTSTHYWKERYPIASYLISIAITNYAQFSNWYRYTNTDSMEVLNYVLPEHLDAALESLPRTIDMLKVFSDLFGQYPFIKEKYGHAEFGKGGAMEHQTMTSTRTFAEDVIAHELAHQWFGDMITCRSWTDLWLNEGFAQYGSALFREQQYGMPSYWTYMNAQLDRARLALGVIGAPDTSSVQDLFNSFRTYSKGAVVLHMLRRVLGDSLFFQSLLAYANDPALKYSTATTQDFQSICERVSGKSLGYFFQEWIYGEGFPTYDYTWTWNTLKDSSVCILNVEQRDTRNNPSFFTMPIDIRLTLGGRDTTVTVYNNAQKQSFTLRCDTPPSAVLLDPDRWILKIAFSGAERPPADYLLEQNFPNPFNGGTTITYRLRRGGPVSLKVYDILGREIITLVESKEPPGFYDFQWIPGTQASGVYFYRLIAGNTSLQKKMIFLK
jgi:aminopeptidase N